MQLYPLDTTASFVEGWRIVGRMWQYWWLGLSGRRLCWTEMVVSVLLSEATVMTSPFARGCGMFFSFAGCGSGFICWTQLHGSSEAAVSAAPFARGCGMVFYLCPRRRYQQLHVSELFQGCGILFYLCRRRQQICLQEVVVV